MRSPLLVTCLLFALPLWAQDTKTAESLLEQDRLAEARKAAEAAVAADDDDAEAHGILGETLFRFGEHAKASEHLRRAAELDPGRWGELVASYEARIAFYHGDDARVRALLPQTAADSWVREGLQFFLSPGDDLQARRSKKGHYLVYTDPPLRKTGGDTYAALLLELIYDAYSKVFPYETDPKLINRVYVLSSNARFTQFRRGMGESDADALGYYVPSFRVLLVNADPDGETPGKHGFTANVLDTIFHEAFHQFMHMHVDDAPEWLDEGLADYFGPSKQVSKKKLKVGIVHRHPTTVTRFERIMEVVMGRDEQRHTPLSQFLVLSTDAFREGERELVHYAQGWSFVHFLLHGAGRKGKKLLKDYFLALKAGRTRAEAHAETFGALDLRKLERAWLAYVKRLKP